MPLIRLDHLEQFAAINILSDPGYDPSDPTIPNAIQVVLNWSLPAGKIAHNVLYGRSAGVPNPTLAMANAIFSGLSTGAQATALLVQLSNTASFTGLTLRDVNTPNNGLITSSGTAAPGTSANPAFPNEVAACVTLRTAKVGPGFRGRLYLAGFNNAGVTAGNQITAAIQSAVNNWANTIPTVFTAQGLTFCLGLHQRKAYIGSTGKPHAARAKTTQDITSQSLKDLNWDSQRRRGLK